MIEPLRRSRVIAIDTPLPPVWVRHRPTLPDQAEQMGTSLFRVGPDEILRRSLAGSIDSALEVVLLASFLLSDELLAEAMLRAAGRGVRVYVLTASETRLASVLKEDDGFENRMVEEHKQLLKQQLGFAGYRIGTLTPRRTRRATAVNWLLAHLADRGEPLPEHGPLPPLLDPPPDPLRGHPGDPPVH